MRFARASFLLLLPFFSLAAAAQIDPTFQINWPLATGTGAPSAQTPALTCTAANYGQPYTDISTGSGYVCSATGWNPIGTAGPQGPAGAAGANGPGIQGNGTVVTPAGGYVNIVGGTNVTVTPGAGTLTISAAGGASLPTASAPGQSPVAAAVGTTYAAGYPVAAEVLDTQGQVNTALQIPCTAYTSIADQVGCSQLHQQLQNAGLESAANAQLPLPTWEWVAGQVATTATGSTGCVPIASLTFAAWSSGTSYSAGNVVASGGSNWIANVAVTSGGSAPAEGANWHQLSGNFMTPTMVSVIGNATLTGTSNAVVPCTVNHTGGPEGGNMVSGNNFNAQSPDHGGGAFGKFAASANTVGQLGTTTTVIRECQRPNPYMHATSGAALGVAGNGDYKSNEWYVTVSTTNVHVAQHQVGAFGSGGATAVTAPMPASSQYFGNGTTYPQPNPGDTCEWLFYDTGLGGLGGTSTAPVVAGAFNDGVLGTTVTLGAALSAATNVTIANQTVGHDVHSLTIWTGANAAILFSQPVRALAWNSGMGSNIFQSYIMPTWTELNKVYLNPNPIALGGDAIANVTAQSYPATTANFTDAGGNYTLNLPAWVRTNPFATYSVTVSSNASTPKSPPYVCFRSQQGSGLLLSQQDLSPNQRWVGFDVDGVYAGFMAPSSYGTQYRCIPLASGTSHTIRFYNGTTIAAVYTSSGVYANATPVSGGPFVDAVGVPKGYTVTVNHPTVAPTTLTYVYGHSVAAGHGTQNGPAYNVGASTNSSWFMISRKMGLFGGGAGSYQAGTSEAICDCFGSRLVWNDFGTSASATAYFTAVAAAQPGITQILQEAVINDRFHNTANSECLVPSGSNANSFMAAEANFVNSAHVAFPSAPIYMTSDIVQTSSSETSLDGCNYTSGTVTNLNTIIALGTLSGEPTAPSCTTSGCNYAAWRRVLYNSVANPTNTTVQTYYSLTAPSATVYHALDWTGCVTQAQIGSDNVHPTVPGHMGIATCVQTAFGGAQTISVPQ